MSHASHPVRYYVFLGIPWVLFAVSVGLAGRDRAPQWMPDDTLQWAAVGLYVSALLIVSVHQAKKTPPRLRWLWVEVLVTCAIFAMTASVLVPTFYDDVIDRDESATPMIFVSAAVIALGVATFPSSYILWRRGGWSAVELDSSQQARTQNLS